MKDWAKRATGGSVKSINGHAYATRGPIRMHDGSTMYWLYVDGSRYTPTGKYDDAVHFKTDREAQVFADNLSRVQEDLIKQTIDQLVEEFDKYEGNLFYKLTYKIAPNKTKTSWVQKLGKGSYRIVDKFTNWGFDHTDRRFLGAPEDIISELPARLSKKYGELEVVS